MEKRIKECPILSCIILFCICGTAGLIEYFVIRTDETVLSENVLHKVFGIAVLAVVLCLLHSSWRDIGFGKSGVASDIVKGLLLGGGCFLIAYLVEGMILYHINGTVSYSFYVSGFSLGEETARQDGLLFFALCIVFNLINGLDGGGYIPGLIYEDPHRKTFFQGERTFYRFSVWALALGHALQRLCGRGDISC